MATVNRGPVLTGKKAIFAAGKEDFTYTMNVNGFAGLLAGYTDPDGDKLSVSNMSVNNGVMTFNAKNNTWTFTPEANFNGLVTLTYDVIDGKGGVAQASQSFMIKAVNDAPTDITLSTISPEVIRAAGSQIATLSSSDVDNSTGFRNEN